jgi:cyclohexa-1,5-dienecarbonyl-CoA hydratase
MISVQQTEHVLQIKINIPPVNVIDTQTCRELAEKLDQASRNPTLSAILISGEGKCFSAGASVEEHEEKKARDMILAFTDACKKLYQIPVPTVALVHGFCFGGGFELTMYCDFIFADPSAKFGVPEIKLAFFPPFACSVLAGIVGRQNASHLIYTGDTVDAQRAFQMGLVQKISEQPEWPQLAKQLNNTSIPVLTLAKKAFKIGQKTTIEEAFDAIANDLFVNDLYKIEDVREGIASFREKRKAQWKHE